MTVEPISTRTVKNDATTTIVTRTTTIVSEHTEIVSDPNEQRHPRNVVQEVRQTLRDYWFPSSTTHDDNDDDDDEAEEEHQRHTHTDPSLLRGNSVVRRAYDYWKSLTRDAEETAKEAVMEAKNARDKASVEARWAILGYKKEAREAYEKAEEMYREALAAAEKAHNEAHEKAKSKWFQAVDKTEKEVGQMTDHVDDVAHKKWDRFKAAVNSFAYNPPKYGCSPSTQYWFSRQNPAADSGWDCREIWDHPSRNNHGHLTLKSLPKKHLPLQKVHDTFVQLYSQAAQKAKTAPSATSFESSIQPVKDYYHRILDKISRNEQGALDELDEMVDKIKARLNEAKYIEEQTDTWLTAQWNTVAHNAGDSKKQYEKAFKNSLKNIQNTRTAAYNNLLNNLQRSVNIARNNIHEAIKATQDQADKSRVHRAVQEAMDAFSNAVREAEAKMKTAPKNAYYTAIDTFNKDTAQLKAKLEHAAEVASKSASSAAHHASKSGSSISHKASKSGSSLGSHATQSVESIVHEASKTASSLSHHASKSAASAAHQITEDAKTLVGDANKKMHHAKDSASSKYQSATDNVRHEYEQATASVSSMWSSATPLAPLHKAQASYYHLLDDIRGSWFSVPQGSGANVSSLYGACLAVYFLYVGRNIWLNRKLKRMRDPRAKSFSVVASGDKLEQEMNSENGRDKNPKIVTYKGRPNMEDFIQAESTSSFYMVTAQFTATLPVTLVLLILLEIAGFSRIALHTLFAGLLTAQLMQGGLLNNALRQCGIIDGVHITSREIGLYLSWVVLAFAAAANIVKVITDESRA
ncbi:hypothetical protein BGZ94_000304 [Podila epigama]|nr:hypothetical protein BGZ94_000304 [Podila epigama]